jgi:hypothetical protein
VYKLTSLAIILFACASSVAGEVSKTFEIAAFDKISFDGSGTVLIVQGDLFGVEVTGEGGLVQSLSVEVSDGVLHIETGNDSISVDDLHFTIAAGTITEVSSHGSGKILMNNIAAQDIHLRGIGSGEFLLDSLNARELSVEGRGASRFKISGKADRQVVELGGAGEYLAQNLITNVGSISIFGAGIGELWVDEWLDVRITGAGKISYRGAPQVAQQVFGFGSVQRLGKL